MILVVHRYAEKKLKNGEYFGNFFMFEFPNKIFFLKTIVTLKGVICTIITYSDFLTSSISIFL